MSNRNRVHLSGTVSLEAKEIVEKLAKTESKKLSHALEAIILQWAASNIDKASEDTEDFLQWKFTLCENKKLKMVVTNLSEAIQSLSQLS